MVKVSFEHKDNYISLRVKGHAGQDNSGNDVVCAAVSILAYTVAQYVTFVKEAEGLSEEPQIILNKGDALIIAKPTAEYEAEVLNAFFVAEVGYSLLVHNYPQYVKLKMFGKGENL